MLRSLISNKKQFPIKVRKSTSIDIINDESSDI